MKKKKPEEYWAAPPHHLCLSFVDGFSIPGFRLHPSIAFVQYDAIRITSKSISASQW